MKDRKIVKNLFAGLGANRFQIVPFCMAHHLNLLRTVHCRIACHGKPRAVNTTLGNEGIQVLFWRALDHLQVLAVMAKKVPHRELLPVQDLEIFQFIVRHELCQIGKRLCAVVVLLVVGLLQLDLGAFKSHIHSLAHVFFIGRRHNHGTSNVDGNFAMTQMFHFVV